MPWFSYHETATGILRAVGSDSAPTPVGVTRTDLVERPNLAEVMWDEGSASFVPRTPVVWVDRSDDIINDPRLSNVNPGIKNQIRNVIDDVLGGERWRKDHHSPLIDGVRGNDTEPET